MPRRPPRLGMARVHGRSMLPTLAPGDRLLLRYDAAPAAGDLVVVRYPDRTIAVKRATARLPDGWWVERDNPREGTDSAVVGTIPEEDVLAVVRARLWPRPAPAGRLQPPAGRPPSG